MGALPSLERPPLFDLVVDSSAVIAVLKGEPTHRDVLDVLADAEAPAMSMGSRLEVDLVASRIAGRVGEDFLVEFVDNRLTLLPVDSHQLTRARDAWQRFGRGRHRASLNFGDCFSYALASHLDVPLLAVGDDFIHTDLRVLPVS